MHRIPPLNEKQENFLADKLMDTANWAIGALVFGQFVGTVTRPLEMTFGIVFYFWILWLSLGWKRR